MKKHMIGMLGVIVISMFLLSSTNVPALTTGHTLMVYTGASPNHTDISGFYGNYSADNTFMNSSDDGYLATNLKDDVEALFLPGNDELTDADMTAIADWFKLGNKLIWIGSDSDYGGYQNAALQNTLLEKLGTVLRFSTDAVADPVANDGASYRPRSTGVGTGPIATAVTKGIDNVTAPFHGPTSIFYMNGTIPTDLRGASVDNVEVIVTASKDAEALDQDLSLTAADFYSANNKTTGNYPLMAVEKMDTSLVVLTGESIFTNYKNMYGYTFEKSGLPHAGKAIVDNTISYYFDSIFKSAAAANFLPIDFVAASFGIFAVAIVAFRRRR